MGDGWFLTEVATGKPHRPRQLTAAKRARFSNSPQAPMSISGRTFSL